jgi:hypothetical protein
MSLGCFDPRIRLRLWINGDLATETWIDTSSDTHAAITDRLLDECAQLIEAQPGCVWMAEIYDPSEPADRAYQRFAHVPGEVNVLVTGIPASHAQ